MGSGEMKTAEVPGTATRISPELFYFGPFNILWSEHYYPNLTDEMEWESKR